MRQSQQKLYIKKLHDLYAEIPAFKCKGCHDCCGPIIFGRIEGKLIRSYCRQNNIPIPVSRIRWQNETTEEFYPLKLDCPFLKDDGCLIYPVRPYICRLQGHVKKLPCKNNPEGMDIDEDRAKLLLHKYWFICQRYLYARR